MDLIPIKALIVDPDPKAARALAGALSRIDSVMFAERRATVVDAREALDELDINVIYIDPLGAGIDNASEFIFGIRDALPTIVFVLYLDSRPAEEPENPLYKGERERFRHYFKLEKSGSGAAFDRRVRQTVAQCQHDLSFNLTQEKIEGLQRELASIQKAALNDTTVVPLTVLHEIAEQLEALKSERASLTVSHSAAPFLGAPASEVAPDRCFVIMPYSQEWSAAVEDILKEVCEAAGLEFSIAREMEGRFVPHDIWKGITGAELIIADLTGANPNVAYEIGLADALGRETILICQDTDVPFDFLAQRLTVYKNTVSGALELRRRLAKKLEVRKNKSGVHGRRHERDFT